MLSYRALGRRSTRPTGPANITNVVYDTNNVNVTTNTFTIGPTNFMVINSTNVLGTNILLLKYDTTNISTRCWITNWTIYSNAITNLWRNITNAAINNILIYSITNNLYFTNETVLTNCGNAYTIVWVTTLAGSTTSGSADGLGTNASFNQPYGVAVDSSGNIYVADVNNNEIRKITPGGVVTTFAGSTTSGHSDGLSNIASFYYPYGVAVDSSGNIYVADTGNNEIRKITPGGVVTTLAGSTIAGHADGLSNAASFNFPTGVAVDSSGNIYVADGGNNEVRKITSGGIVTTLAGSTIAGHADGLSNAASFQNPRNVAVDLPGNVYVADQNNHEIRKITSGGG